MVSVDSHRNSIPLLTPDGVNSLPSRISRHSIEAIVVGSLQLREIYAQGFAQSWGFAHSKGEACSHKRPQDKGESSSNGLLTGVLDLQLLAPNNKRQLYIYLPAYKAHTSRVWWAHAKHASICPLVRKMFLNFALLPKIS